MSTPDPAPCPPAPQPARRWLPLRAGAVVLARARFLLLVGGLLGLIAAWPFLQNYWAKLTGTAPTGGTVSPDTEYWCPMCPGVVSDWPTKCPVCNMTLVRRQKGEMTPLPDGVVARVQLSPYRLQLAGVRTSAVEYLRMEYEVTAAGFLEAVPGSGGESPLFLAADVFERDAEMLSVGQEGQVSCDARPGETAAGRIAEITPAAVPAAGRRVRVRVENPRAELRPGQYAAAKFRTPVARLDSHRRLELERWRDRAAVGFTLASLGRIECPPSEGPLFALVDAGVRHAAARQGFALGVPESAVIDTGTRQVVYVESMPGTFDAVEVRLGRRCGDFYPVRSGLELGHRVATAGAVLLDAETHLNPSVAASYFGSGSRPPAAPQKPAAPSSPAPDDRQLIARQKLCPVSGEDLDSMGGPVKVVVNGRVVFVCCKSCEKPLVEKPEKYLPKLPK
jgi:membrane fusion protein, copper/silver efflux system